MDARVTPVGTIVKVHGLQGEVVVNPTVSQPEALEKISLFLVEDATGQRRPVRVEQAKLIAKSGRFSFFVKFERIDTREDARLLVGGALLLDAVSARKHLPKAAPSWNDVTGFRARDPENGFQGTVLEVLTGGGQPLLHIKAEGRTLLVPAVDAYVSAVDVRRRSIELLNTAMLLEL